MVATLDLAACASVYSNAELRTIILSRKGSEKSSLVRSGKVHALEPSMQATPQTAKESSTSRLRPIALKISCLARAGDT